MILKKAKKSLPRFPLFIVLLLSVALTVNAVNAPTLSNVIGVTLSVNFKGPQIYLSITVGGYFDTVYKDGTVTLSKLSGDCVGEVKRWTGLSSENSVFRFTDKSVTPTSGTYRLSVSVTAVRAGVTETISGYKDVIYISGESSSDYYMPGDLNCSGTLTAVDLTVLMKIISGKTVTSVFQSMLADVNTDGKINAQDLTRLMKTIAGSNLIF